MSITPTKKNIIPPFSFDKRLIPTVVKKGKGYMPQAKSKGKWKNLSKKPMSRTAALGRMARVVDNTTSSQGRIKQKKGKISPVKDNYFNVNSNKFRPYKIVKGKKKKMANQFIEVRSKRIDSRGEKMGLSVAKMTKNNGWLMGNTKKSKKKGDIKKSPWLV